MQFLDFFDFLTNSVMMPIAAITTCLLVSRVIGVEKIEEEVTLEGKPFRRKRIFNFMIKYLCPIFRGRHPPSARWQTRWASSPCKQTTKSAGSLYTASSAFLMPVSGCSLSRPDPLQNKMPLCRSGLDRPHLDHVGQQSFQPGVVAIEVIEDAGASRWPSETLDITSAISSSVPVPPGERDKGITQLDHPGLALGHVLRDDEPGQAVILHLGVDEELGLDAGHLTARRQNAVGQTPHQAAAGAAVDQRVPTLADPAAQFLHRLFQGRVAALIGPR